MQLTNKRRKNAKQMKKWRTIRRFTCSALAFSALAYGPGVKAQDTKEPDIKALLSRIDELENKVKVLERNREIDQDAVEEKKKTDPTFMISGDGLAMRTANSNFVAYVRGYAQLDGRFYPGTPNAANDTFLLRRVRPILEGTIYEKFDYRLMMDFGTGNGSASTLGNNALLNDAYVNARFSPLLQLQAGKFKSPVGLERLRSTADLTFVETGFATQLTPNYDLGIMLHNDLFKSPYSYAIGVFNGAADAGSDDADTTDAGKDVVARVFAQPWLDRDFEPLRRLGFGVGGSAGNHEGTLSSYKTAGQQNFFQYDSRVAADGQQYRIDPQLFYYWGPFGINGEYVLSSQRLKSTINGTSPHQRISNRAWQAEASYFLTGEENTFKPSSSVRVSPLKPFLNGGWGAFELAARLQQITMDQYAFSKYSTAVSARQATAWGVGINWYLNRNVKFNLDYEVTSFSNGSTAAGSVTGRQERTILSQIQFAF